jgi:peptidoglycan hydrolase-like protein with peptidoglycan-binding domain
MSAVDRVVAAVTALAAALFCVLVGTGQVNTPKAPQPQEVSEETVATAARPGQPRTFTGRLNRTLAMASAEVRYRSESRVGELELAPITTRTDAALIPCAGDGTSGPRIRFFYGYLAAGTNHIDKVRPYLQDIVKVANGMMVASAAQTGGYRSLRVYTDPDCEPVITPVAMPALAATSLTETKIALIDAGEYHPEGLHVVFLDASELCGIGETVHDDRPGPDNKANTGGRVARIDEPCWRPSTTLHEVMHMLGAVQASAPNSVDAHCFDEEDIMCYKHPDHSKEMETWCEDEVSSERLDCGKDDYFHTDPPAGSYLATHWNTADSVFLYDAEPTPADLFGAATAGPWSCGPAVQAVQEHLRALGFTSREPGLRWRPDTTLAVARWEAKSGLVVDGVISGGDWAALSGRPYQQVTGQQLTAEQVQAVAHRVNRAAVWKLRAGEAVAPVARLTGAGEVGSGCLPPPTYLNTPATEQQQRASQPRSGLATQSARTAKAFFTSAKELGEKVGRG